MEASSIPTSDVSFMSKVEPVSSISPKPGLVPGESSGLEKTKNSDRSVFASSDYDVRHAPVFVLHCVPNFASAGHFSP